MDKEKKGLYAKMFMAYQMMYSTDGKTKIVEKVVRKMKTRIRKILINNPSDYREVDNFQIGIYKEAWKKAFGNDTDVVISVSFVLIELFESVNEPNKFISKGDIDKVLSSFFYSDNKGSKYQDIDELEVETSGKELGKAIVELLDGKKELTPFQKRMRDKKKENK